MVSQKNYTAIIKLDDQFENVWVKVFKTDFRRTEPIILDKDEQYLYTVFKNGQFTKTHDMIVKITESDGTFANSLMIRKHRNAEISLLHYHSDDKISFLLSQVYQQASF